MPSPDKEKLKELTVARANLVNEIDIMNNVLGVALVPFLKTDEKNGSLIPKFRFDLLTNTPPPEELEKLLNGVKKQIKDALMEVGYSEALVNEYAFIDAEITDEDKKEVTLMDSQDKVGAKYLEKLFDKYKMEIYPIIINNTQIFCASYDFRPYQPPAPEKSPDPIEPKDEKAV